MAFTGFLSPTDRETPTKGSCQDKTFLLEKTRCSKSKWNRLFVICDFPFFLWWNKALEMNPVNSCFRNPSRIIYFIYHKKKSVTAERAERNKNYLH